MQKTLMIIGIGDLAGLALNLLAQEEEFGRIVLAGRNMEEMSRRRNLATLFSAQLGRFHNIDCVQLDLRNEDQATAAIAEVKPDIIFNTATLQSWRIITQLPAPIFRQLDEAQYGPWLPMHLALVHKLMRAVRQSGVQPIVVNAAFPDAVGPVLKTTGLAPHIGIGNVANVIPALRGAIAMMLKERARDVSVRLFTQHYLSHRVPAYGNSGGAPYYAEVSCNGRDVSSDIDLEQAFGLVQTRFQRTGGAFRQLITAASAMSVLMPLLRGRHAEVHAPAPDGLPGGYCVRVGSREIDVVVPQRAMLSQLIEINQQCQRYDGIESIEPNGTTVFAPAQMQIMHDMLGYQCERMPLAEVDEWATELGAKYREFAARVSA
ncbi:hypothetical protein [Trinickia acidisoli]|uniref:hypothetical protein n=1 Tax=Trinickia acidisoli TaxID=2767482 RepID=UPI001A8D8AE2|nr:hypothetical protein [Trinickia acidisoli]